MSSQSQIVYNEENIYLVIRHDEKCVNISTRYPFKKKARINNF